MDQTRRRIVLGFDVIGPRGDDTLEQASKRIGPALGCAFEEYEERERHFFKSTLLGMAVHLTTWPRKQGSLLFLHAYAPWSNQEESDVLRIDQAVIDLLAQAGFGQWREPTEEDVEARETFVREAETALEGDEPDPT